MKFRHSILTACTVLAMATSSVAAQRISSFSAPQLPLDQKKSFQFEPGKQARPTLFVFWASWCTSCKYEVNDLLDLYQQKGKTLDLVGISVDEDVKKAEGFVQSYKLPYVNVYDEKAKVSDLFHVRALPTLVLVESNGEVRHSGFRLDSAMKSAIDNTK